ncbi:hypothetical protein DB032_19600 [Chromobacterium sp. Panama]|nr:hypothetical protein DB032_19600 [Chromobacterium sp. Panama]
MIGKNWTKKIDSKLSLPNSLMQCHSNLFRPAFIFSGKRCKYTEWSDSTIHHIVEVANQFLILSRF